MATEDDPDVCGDDASRYITGTTTIVSEDISTSVCGDVH